MTIYIEGFIIQNIIINFCILRLVTVTSKQKTKLLNLVLSSVFGAGISVFSAIFLTNQLILNITKLFCAIFMLLLAFKQTKKQFISNFILLFVYTYALGGAIIGLGGVNYKTSFGVVISSKVNLEVICSAIIVLTYIIEMVAKHLKFKLKTNNYIFPITIIKDAKKIKLNAYLDTGNLLNYNGNPVIVVDLDAYLKLSNTNLIDFYLSKAESLNAGTISGESNLKIFKIDKIIIHAGKQTIKLENQYIGVNANTSFKNTNYQALLSPLML